MHLMLTVLKGCLHTLSCGLEGRRLTSLILTHRHERCAEERSTPITERVMSSGVPDYVVFCP